MVCEWGMGESVGPISYGQKEEPIFLGKEIARHKDYSEDTAQQIDREIKQIVFTCLEAAKEHLAANRDKLTLLAKTLLSSETLDDFAIRKLLGFPPIAATPAPDV